jgi:outer membrane immunogenic protein
MRLRPLQSALVATASLAIASSVAAAPKPSAWTYAWTGWYVGGNFGYGWGNDGTINFNPTGSAGALFAPLGADIVDKQIAALGPLDPKPQGILGGLQTGYNVQFGAFVLGVETD